MPGAGHMVHMPAHIYQRVGRHADVIRVNQLAAKADEDYIAQCRAQGIYPLAYYPHNLHFIWMGASASGQKTLAIESARKLAAAIPQDALASRRSSRASWSCRTTRWCASASGTRSSPNRAVVRLPVHAQHLALRARAWRSSIAVASTMPSASSPSCKTLSLDPSLKGQTTFSANTGVAIVQIAPEIVAGEIALKRGDLDRAIAHFDRAVRYEDALVYQEPPDWHVPARQNLAAALLAADRAAEAETVLWEDLKRNPEHGWTLALLSKALKTQDKSRTRRSSMRASPGPGRERMRSLMTSVAGIAMVAHNGRGACAANSFASMALANGVHLHYARQGPDGPAIIFLHGYSDSSFSFSRVMPLLPPELRVIAPDLRGHGPRPAGGRLSRRRLCDDVLGMMDLISVAIIVGHSMGSFVAQAIAERAPQRVSRLMLLSSASVADNPGMRELRREVNSLSDPVDRGSCAPFNTARLPRRFPARSWIRPSATADACRRTSGERRCKA